MKRLMMLPAAVTLAAVVHAQGQPEDVEHPPTLSDNPSELRDPARGGRDGANPQAGQERPTETLGGGQSPTGERDLGATGHEGQGGSYHDWSMVDKDQDGQLSTDEAREALPDLVIVDINNDGMLNRSEAESAMPGLRLGDEGQAAPAGSGDAAVNEQDYLVIISAIEAQNRRDQAMLGGAAANGQNPSGQQGDEES